MSGPVPSDDPRRRRADRGVPAPLRALAAVAALATPVSGALALAVVVEFGPGIAPTFLPATLAAAVGGAALETGVAPASADDAGGGPRLLVHWGFVVPVLVTAAFLLLVAAGRRTGVAPPTVEYGALAVATVTVTVAEALRG